ncbi:MAG: family 10 glycosylhydrolase [Acidobacteriota bacterium]|nr:family 10 glycosylhydrolase [Acidobacteriota bacterium]
MRRAVSIIVAYLVLLLSALLPAQKTAAPTPTLPPPQRVETGMAKAATPQPIPSNEVRALWVVRHTMSSPQAVKEMVTRAKANGFTDLIVQVRGRGDAYYKSRVEPRADELAGQPTEFDPLALTLDEAHRIGIRVHAWINIYVVADIEKLPQTNTHLIYQHPEWLMIPREIAKELFPVDPKSPDYLNRLIEFTRNNRTELEGLYTSPAHPAVKESLIKIWLDIAERYEVDGLHFDYVRYPNTNFDYSRSALEHFRSEVEKNLNEEQRTELARQFDLDPMAYAANFPDLFADFQRRQVTDLVERVYKGVKAVKPHAIISAAVFANTEDAARSKFQDWRQWMRLGWLDVACPMSYTPDTEAFRRQINNAVKLASGKQIWAGIGGYKQTAESSIEKIKASRELGAQGFALFSYDSSVKASPDFNPQSDYLERLREAWLPSMPRLLSQ